MPSAEPTTSPTKAQCRPATLGGDLRIALTRVSRAMRSQRGGADLPEGQFGVLTVLHKHGQMTPARSRPTSASARPP